MTTNQLHASTIQLTSINDLMQQIHTMTNFVLDSHDVDRDAISLNSTYPNLASVFATDRRALAGSGLTDVNHVHAISSGPAKATDVDVGADGKKKRKPRKPKDPNEPVRPVTAYFLYLSENKERIRNELGEEAKPGAIQKRGTDEWNEMTEPQKEVWSAPIVKESSGC